MVHDCGRRCGCACNSKVVLGERLATVVAQGALNTEVGPEAEAGRRAGFHAEYRHTIVESYCDRSPNERSVNRTKVNVNHPRPDRGRKVRSLWTWLLSS
jgi:hypothetical protein